MAASATVPASRARTQARNRRGTSIAAVVAVVIIERAQAADGGFLQRFQRMRNRKVGAAFE